MARSIRDFCVECGGNFGILERDEQHRNTCTECIARLRPSSAGECSDCGRLIQIGEKYHLEWVLLCQNCVRHLNRHRDVQYKLNCVGSRHFARG